MTPHYRYLTGPGTAAPAQTLRPRTEQCSPHCNTEQVDPVVVLGENITNFYNKEIIKQYIQRLLKYQCLVNHSMP